MRSFIIASLILLALIGLIVCSSCFVTAKLDRLLELAEKNGSPDPEMLLSEWQSCRAVISLSINRSELDRAENALCALSAFTPGSDAFNAKLSEFICAIRSIRDAQCLSLENIL